MSAAGRPPDAAAWIVRVLLQAAHRAAALALILMVVTLAIVFSGGDFHWPLASAFAVADAGVCLAAVAMWSHLPDRREAVGVALFNGLLLALSLQLMFISRLDILRQAANTFFTPR